MLTKVKVVSNVGNKSVQTFGPEGTVLKINNGFLINHANVGWTEDGVPFDNIDQLNEYFKNKEGYETLFESAAKSNFKYYNIVWLVAEEVLQVNTVKANAFNLVENVAINIGFVLGQSLNKHVTYQILETPGTVEDLNSKTLTKIECDE